MEDSGSKVASTRMDITPASIVDLKAELFRKQQEYEQRKSLGSDYGSYVKGKKISESSRKGSIWERKNAGVVARSAADKKERDVTDSDKLEASRLALEAKSKLYEKMASIGDNAEDEDGHSLYLVDFEQKHIDKTMEMRKQRLAKEDKISSSDPKDTNIENSDKHIIGDLPDDSNVPDEEKWVDFVDSFGRSRRCMKKDLAKLQALDKQTGINDEPPDLMSADMQRERLREKWEKEQREMLDNQETVHYTNVQFDEQRAHGAGYYQFSKDEDSRQKEMEQLKKQREETQSNRVAKKKLLDKRKAMLSARLEKVKQRRLAQGKPVPTSRADSEKQEDEEIVPERTTDLHNEKLMNQSKEEPVAAKHPSIREWDLGKPDLLIPRKPEKPKGWINPRDVRDEEFAPPSFYYPKPAQVPSSFFYSTPPQPSLAQVDAPTKESKPSSESRQLHSSLIIVPSDIPLPPTAPTEHINIASIESMIKSLRDQT